MSVDEISKATSLDLFVYPNPFQTQVTTVVNEEISSGEIQVYSMTGKLIYSERFNKNQVVLDLSRLIDGIYIISVIADGKQYVEKVIKSN